MVMVGVLAVQLATAEVLQHLGRTRLAPSLSYQQEQIMKKVEPPSHGCTPGSAGSPEQASCQRRGAQCPSGFLGLMHETLAFRPSHTWLKFYRKSIFRPRISNILKTHTGFILFEYI